MMRPAPAYHDDPAYIEALALSVEEYMKQRKEAGKGMPDKLITSYHGLPKSYLMKGDPYHCHCQKTTRLLAERLGWDRDQLVVTFQSRFGPEEWLQPYTVKHVAELAKAGNKDIAIMAPAFSSDCVETLEEIQEEIKEAFEEAGGENFDYIPCLNDDEAHIDMITMMAKRETLGWF